MPIAWQDWTGEAFRRAREEKRPALLFLGTSWCPVTRRLDREFFAEPAVQETVRRDFVALRVDAERRPDVNERYNAGGWPTVAFLTPAGAVLWANSTGDPAQIRPVLQQVAGAYATHKAKLEEEIRRRDEKLEEQRREIYALTSKPGTEVFRKTVRGILFTLDATNGGFGREPKFPMTASLQVILQAYREAGGPDLRDTAAVSLAAFERGLFDPSAGGFYRYCEEADWTRPHKEKLCEDNGALIRAFLDAWALLGNKSYRDKAARAVDWAVRTLWDGDTVAASQAADGSVDRTMITPSASVLCSAFLRAAVLLARRDLADLAFRCLEGIAKRGLDPARGVAHYFDPEPRAYGFARSQAFFSRALLDAYEASGRGGFLDDAVRVLDFCRSRLWGSAERGILDRVPGDDDPGELARRRKNIQENAVLAESSCRLAHLTGDARYLEFARLIVGSFPEFLDDYGHYTAEHAVACDWLSRPVVEVDLTAPTEAWIGAALASPIPRRIVRHLPGPAPSARVSRGGAEVASPRTPEELRAAVAGLP